MNIAHVIGYQAKFPLQKWNSRYKWVEEIALSQALLGHTVTIYCGGGFIPGVNIKTTHQNTSNVELFELATSSDHDIIHSHFDNLHYEFSNRIKDKKIVFTQHWRIVSKTRELSKLNMGNVFAVPATQFMHSQNILHGVLTTDFIYHGIDLDKFVISKKNINREHLSLIARIDPQKGILQAVEYANQANEKLIIAGKMISKFEDYYNLFLSKVDSHLIRYLGQQTVDEVVSILQSSKAMLSPVQEIESFGLSVVEAQACGAPVIASDSGAMSELIIHGQTGFICKTKEDFIEAIKNVHLISSEKCRENSLRFDYKKMVSNYIEMYKNILKI